MHRGWTRPSRVTIRIGALLIGVAIASAFPATPEARAESADQAAPQIAGIVEGKPVFRDALVDKEIQEARDKLFELESAKLREVALGRLREARPKEFPVPVFSATEEEVKKVYEDAKLSKRGTLEQLTPQIRAYLTQQKRAEIDKRHYELALLKGYVKPLLIPPAEFEVELAAVSRPASKGPGDAPVEIVEFSDFQCPFCQRALPTVKQVLEKYEGKVRFTYRHLPLTRIHARAQELAEASECAAEQGRFWRFHDLVFDQFSELETLDVSQLAKQAGVRDAKRFDGCREGRLFRARVEEDMAVAESLGIGGTPTFLIGRRTEGGTIKGVLLEGAQPAPAFERAIDRVLDKAQR